MGKIIMLVMYVCVHSNLDLWFVNSVNKTGRTFELVDLD